MNRLSSLSRIERKFPKRVGRGPGSGTGKTCGRGMKGRYSISGATLRIGYEGGQYPLYRKLPTRGFSNARFARKKIDVTVHMLQELAESGKVFDSSSLVSKHQLSASDMKNYTFRVIAGGDLNKKIPEIRAHHFTKGAKAYLEAKGVTCTLVPFPQFVHKKK